jgi:hypothetical protein
MKRRAPVGTEAFPASVRRPAAVAEVTVRLPLLPARAAAAYLGGMSEGTLENWRISGKGPNFVQYHEGGPVFYKISDLDRFIEAHTRAATGTALVESDELEAARG